MKYTQIVSRFAVLAALFVLPIGAFAAETQTAKAKVTTPAPVKPKPRSFFAPKPVQYVAITVTKFASPSPSAMVAKSKGTTSRLVKNPPRKLAAKTIPAGTPMVFQFTIPNWVNIDPAHQVTLNLRCYYGAVTYQWKIIRGAAAGLTEIELDGHTPSQWFPNSVPVVVQ